MHPQHCNLAKLRSFFALLERICLQISKALSFEIVLVINITLTTKNETNYYEMHRSGFEPELLAWKAKVIAARPSMQESNYL